jgi:chitinase
MSINMNWNTYAMSTAVTGTLIPVVGSGSLYATQVPTLPAISLAFATGECGSENWAGVTPSEFISANITPGAANSLASAGLNYIVSTGGQAGVFTCGSASSFESFIARYYTAQMIGVDFDIEGGQTQAEIQQLVADVAAAQSQYPNMRFSFTLATLGASDGSYGGINQLGQWAVQAIKASSPALKNYTINLMTMDYGSASASNCVVVSGVCEMGQSAVQAVTNLEHSYGIPASHIELTPMIGQNDTGGEVTTLADIDTITNYATANGLAGVHFWSLDRDTPCAAGSASATCNSYPSAGVLAFTKRVLSDIGK